MTKTVLITGASRGIGAATALLAAKRGYNVCVNYFKSKEAAYQVVDTINNSGGKAIPFQANIASASEVKSLFEEIDKTFNSLDALVNNAGILETQSRVDKMDIDRLQRVFNTNVCSYFICAREAINRMSTKKSGNGGVIVNVSSIAAKTGSPHEYVDYAASKAAIDTFTIGLSKEIASDNIRVNGVRPGFIYTDIHATGGEPERVDRIKDTLPLKRGGNPDDVAQAILWLMSDESSYSTGTFIDVAGGI